MLLFNHVSQQAQSDSGGKGMLGACNLNICINDGVVKKSHAS